MVVALGLSVVVVLLFHSPVRWDKLRAASSAAAPYDNDIIETVAVLVADLLLHHVCVESHRCAQVCVCVCVHT